MPRNFHPVLRLKLLPKRNMLKMIAAAMNVANMNMNMNMNIATTTTIPWW